MPLFVFEIGTEEMPARFLPVIEQGLADFFVKALEEQHLSYKAIALYSTPRRCTLTITDLAEKQTSFEEVISGPPIALAFAKDGQPTPAALGFAKSQGATLDETFTLSTEKGAYLAVRRQRGGLASLDLLPGICLSALESLPFPKKMCWADRSFAFGRPIRWILALLDKEVLQFEAAGVLSGRQTYGHRIMGPGPFTIPEAADYQNTLESQGKVCLSTAERRQRLIEQGDRLAKQIGARPIWKDSLMDEVCGLLEWPKLIMGNFDPDFLELPREVLLTSMERHQKSFGLDTLDRHLKPCFLTALNLESSDENLVRKGWERVLKARLEDARFFWKTDLANGFDQWLKDLERVVFLGPLGSMGDKSRRLERLAEILAIKIAPDQAADLAKAGRLAKADLVSEMVGEFADLQGIMGGIYAEKNRMSQAISLAIYDHYLPLGPDSPVPSTVAGAILAVADKADTLVGCFGLDLNPTGTADPYALRRSALGICRIIIDHAFDLDLREIFQTALDGYGQRTWKIPAEEIVPRLLEFMLQRIKAHLISQGFDTLLIEAGAGAGANDLNELLLRLETLRDFSREPDFPQAVLTFKRAANILRKQGRECSPAPDGSYQRELLLEPAEKNLADRLEFVTHELDCLAPNARYPAMPRLLRELRPALDDFFDQVMVMCPDPQLSRNRLNLLQALVSRSGRLADFSLLQY